MNPRQPHPRKAPPDRMPPALLASPVRRSQIMNQLFNHFLMRRRMSKSLFQGRQRGFDLAGRVSVANLLRRLDAFAISFLC